jgi:hypothetical protein
MSKSIAYEKKPGQGHSLTSWGEVEDSWASRETSGSLAFSKRLRFRGPGTFWAAALVTPGAISWVGGSSSTAGGIEGVAVVSFGGSLSSLQAETSYIQIKDKYGASAELKEHLRCHEIKELDTLFKNRGFVSHSSRCRGT